MSIIGRCDEIRELEKCEKTKKSELVCVYGRRRVGKTYLVEQTFGNYFAFRATGVESGNTRTQLKSFYQRLAEAGDKTRRVPRNWFEAFSRLEKVLEAEDITRSIHGKKIVFFDEFPWFATARSDFLEAFGEFWNRCGTVHGNYLFIICGSATSWIIKNVLEDAGSLYDRVTSQIFLRPFSLRETELYMEDKTIPAVKRIQDEIEDLTSQKNAGYTEYRESQKREKELQTVKANIETILRQQEPEIGQENKAHEQEI